MTSIPTTTVVHAGRDEFDVYIGRAEHRAANPKCRETSPLANPFVVAKETKRKDSEPPASNAKGAALLFFKERNLRTLRVASREIAIEAFEHLMRLRLDHPEQSQMYVLELMKCDGKRLGCWCAPKPCHGHVIVKLLDEIRRATGGKPFVMGGHIKVDPTTILIRANNSAEFVLPSHASEGPPVIVAEVSVNWPQQDGKPLDILSKRMELAIEVNMKRGYRLTDVYLHRLVTKWRASPPEKNAVAIRTAVEMVETAIMIFTRWDRVNTVHRLTIEESGAPRAFTDAIRRFVEPSKPENQSTQ